MRSTFAIRSNMVLTLAISGVLLAAAGIVGAKETDTSPESLSRQAKINLLDAEDTALKEVPGRTKKIEMEWDDGVLQYRFEICTPKHKMEVRINAASGSVIKVDRHIGFCGDDRD